MDPSRVETVFPFDEVKDVDEFPRYCTLCASPRKVLVCPRCNVDTVIPHPSWEHPKLPDVEEVRAAAREVGYAIAVHGSLERDLDLIAVPWVASAVPAKELAEHVAKKIGGHVINGEYKPYGRYAVSIQKDGWYRLIDLSITPRG